MLHSCTKYLNGHSDIVAGAVIGSKAWIERITHRLNHLGGSLDPHACFLLDRGLKTLVLRVQAPMRQRARDQPRARSAFEGREGELSGTSKSSAARARPKSARRR